jgi:hypothetical protein
MKNAAMPSTWKCKLNCSTGPFDRLKSKAEPDSATKDPRIIAASEPAIAGIKDARTALFTSLNKRGAKEPARNKTIVA